MFELSKILHFVHPAPLLARRCRAVLCRACTCGRCTQLHGTRPPAPFLQVLQWRWARTGLVPQAAGVDTASHQRLMLLVEIQGHWVWRALLPLADGSRAAAAPARLSLSSLGVGSKEKLEAGQIWRGFIATDRSTAEGTGIVLLWYQFTLFFPFW